MMSSLRFEYVAMVAVISSIPEVSTNLESKVNRNLPRICNKHHYVAPEVKEKEEREECYFDNVLSLNL
jgi:hypothetical protein